MATPTYGAGLTHQQIGSNNTGTNVVGAKLTTNVTSGRGVIQDLGPVRVNKNIAPVYVLAKKGGIKKEIRLPEFQWHEEDGLQCTVTTTASEIAAADTTINLASGQGNRVVAGMNLLCERTGELIHIVSISTDALTVVREITTTPAKAIIATGGVAEELTIMASNMGENSLAPSAISVEPTKIINYAQTIRRASAEMSRRLQNGEFYGTPEFERVKQDAMDAFMRDLEFAFLFTPGYKSTNTDTTNGTISQGIEAFIQDNNFNVAGVANDADLSNWLLVWKRMNHSDTSELVLFGGDGLSRCIDSIGRDNIRYNPENDVLGMEIDTYQSSVGKFKIKFHPAFSPQYGSVTAANNGRVGQAIGLNYKNIGVATYKGGKIRAETHIEAISTDGRKDGIICDMGWILQNQRTHVNVVGMTN